MSNLKVVPHTNALNVENADVSEIDESSLINYGDNNEQIETTQTQDTQPQVKSHFIINQTLPFVYISFFSIIGCFVRIGIDLIFSAELAHIESSTQIIVQSYFSNISGCFLLGFIHGLHLKPGPLVTGLTTGLCGCLTTYSKWNQQISLLLVGMVTTTSQSQLSAICVIMIGMLTYSCSYITGEDFSRLVVSRNVIKCQLSKRASTICHCCITISLVIIITVLLALIFIYQSTSHVILTLCLSGLLAPLGASMRYVISMVTPKFDFKRKVVVLNRVPTGTLLANVLGSIAIAVCYVIKLHTRNTTTMVYLDGIQTGFLASLTTVSSFIGEVIHLRNKPGNTGQRSGNTASYAYVLITITLCLFCGSMVNLTSVNVYHELGLLSDLANMTNTGL
ncbi:uncharacterized protein LOC100183087 [Ciona intestinalis]